MLSGKLALVTGGGSGIGRATCQLFAKNGASVIVADVKAGEETKQLLVSAQNHHSAFHTDVSDSNSVQQLKDAVFLEYNGKAPDILVNNAGVNMPGPMHHLDEQVFDRVLDINLKGPFLLTKIFSQMMIEAKLPTGSIINISSILGKVGYNEHTNYAASKAGLIGLTKSVAKELGQYNIRCNVILPGLITTPMSDKVKNIFADMPKQIPLRRVGEPEEIAQACLFLASDMSTYVTGASIEVTGGESM